MFLVSGGWRTQPNTNQATEIYRPFDYFSLWIWFTEVKTCRAHELPSERGHGAFIATALRVLLRNISSATSPPFTKPVFLWTVHKTHGILLIWTYSQFHELCEPEASLVVQTARGVLTESISQLVSFPWSILLFSYLSYSKEHLMYPTTIRQKHSDGVIFHLALHCRQLLYLIISSGKLRMKFYFFSLVQNSSFGWDGMA